MTVNVELARRKCCLRAVHRPREQNRLYRSRAQADLFIPIDVTFDCHGNVLASSNKIQRSQDLRSTPPFVFDWCKHVSEVGACTCALAPHRDGPRCVQRVHNSLITKRAVFFLLNDKQTKVKVHVVLVHTYTMHKEDHNHLVPTEHSQILHKLLLQGANKSKQQPKWPPINVIQFATWCDVRIFCNINQLVYLWFIFQAWFLWRKVMVKVMANAVDLIYIL